MVGSTPHVLKATFPSTVPRRMSGGVVPDLPSVRTGARGTPVTLALCSVVRAARSTMLSGLAANLQAAPDAVDVATRTLPRFR